MVTGVPGCPSSSSLACASEVTMAASTSRRISPLSMRTGPHEAGPSGTT